MCGSYAPARGDDQLGKDLNLMSVVLREISLSSIVTVKSCVMK
jgi:hypothetical protein